MKPNKLAKSSLGQGLGKGHGGNSNLPVIREVEDDKIKLLSAMGGIQPGTRRFKMGRVLILLSPPVVEEEMGWHMSISHPERYPSWDEIAKAWYDLVPEADKREGVMILPKREDYVNIHNFCFHIHEQIGD
jgi:hypothetical protein